MAQLGQSISGSQQLASVPLDGSARLAADRFQEFLLSKYAPVATGEPSRDPAAPLLDRKSQSEDRVVVIGVAVRRHGVVTIVPIDNAVGEPATEPAPTPPPAKPVATAEAAVDESKRAAPAPTTPTTPALGSEHTAVDVPTPELDEAVSAEIVGCDLPSVGDSALPVPTPTTSTKALSTQALEFYLARPDVPRGQKARFAHYRALNAERVAGGKKPWPKLSREAFTTGRKRGNPGRQ